MKYRVCELEDGYFIVQRKRFQNYEWEDMGKFLGESSAILYMKTIVDYTLNTPIKRVIKESE